MEFHISRVVREATQVDDLLFSYTGNVVFANVAASRKLAAALNEARGPNANPAGAYNAGALFAMGLIDELSHALVARYRKQVDPSVLSEAVRWFAAQTDPDKLEPSAPRPSPTSSPTSRSSADRSPPPQWLAGTTDGLPNREAALEELLLLWIANINPAFKPFQTLFEDTGLQAADRLFQRHRGLPRVLRHAAAYRPEIGSLYDALRAPILASPDSLTGQLDFIREHWAPYLGEDLRRILLAIDVLREEDIAIWMRFHPPGPDQYRHGAPTWGSQGFVGDEFIGFDETSRRKNATPPATRRRSTSTKPSPPTRPGCPTSSSWPRAPTSGSSSSRRNTSATSTGSTTSPTKSCSSSPTAASPASGSSACGSAASPRSTIKRLRGHHDAVASAYSLKNYDIAEDLGGWAAYDHLKHRAAAAGLRLASDMVPNHMGIDSPWVIEHPDWFIHRWESPFPAYSFNGPDLSTDPRVEIKIDDHYYDQTDAAVAFRLRHHADGATALHLPRQRRHHLRLERHRAARLLQGLRPRARHPDHPARRAALPHHPLRRRHGARQAPRPAPLVPAARRRRLHPIARRKRHVAGRVRRASCRTSSGARSSTASPSKSPARCCSPKPSGCSKATSSAPSACTASTTPPS